MSISENPTRKAMQEIGRDVMLSKDEPLAHNVPVVLYFSPEDLARIVCPDSAPDVLSERDLNELSFLHEIGVREPADTAMLELTDDEERCVQMRFGLLGGKEMTYDAIGKDLRHSFSGSTASVRVKTAIKKLKEL